MDAIELKIRRKANSYSNPSAFIDGYKYANEVNFAEANKKTTKVYEAEIMQLSRELSHKNEQLRKLIETNNTLSLQLDSVKEKLRILKDAPHMNYVKRYDTFEFDEVLHMVAHAFNMSVEDVKQRSRKRHIVRARHTVMYLSVKYLGITLTKTAALLSNNEGIGYDHSTVNNAIKCVENMANQDERYKSVLTSLISTIIINKN